MNSRDKGGGESRWSNPVSETKGRERCSDSDRVLRRNDAGSLDSLTASSRSGRREEFGLTIVEIPTAEAEKKWRKARCGIPEAEDACLHNGGRGVKVMPV